MLNAFAIYGQNEKMSFKHISLDKGLSQSSVFCITKDKRGFMWFGTEDGLNRYDGYNFKIYKPGDKDTIKDTIADRFIRCIYKDPQGILWIGTDSGLNKFDPDNEKFTHHLQDQQITAICGSKDTYLWIGTDGEGLNRFDPEKVNFKNDSEVINSLSHDSVTCILEDRTGLLWVGTKKGLNRFNLDEKNFKRFQHQEGDVNSLSNDIVTCICEDKTGVLWIGTRKGLNRLDPNNNKKPICFKPDTQKFDNSYIRSIYECKSGDLLIGTQDDGLYNYDKKIECSNYKYSPFIIDSLNSNSIRSIYEDEIGLLWIGTFGGGINIFDPRMKPFEFYNDIRIPQVSAIYKDKEGTLWIGSYKGIYQYDPKREKEGEPFQPLYGRNLSSESIYSIYEDRSNNLWIGTQMGLNKWNRKKRQFEDLKSSCQNYIDDSINTICEDSKGNLYIGTSNEGIFKYDRDIKRFTTIKISSNEKIVVMYKDKGGTLWVGTKGGGLYRFNENKEEFIPNKNTIMDNRINAITEDSLGNLWIGTWNGLYKIDAKTDKVEPFQEENGLSSGMIYGLLPDNKGNIWITTPRGISCFNTSIRTFSNYETNSDLANTEFYLGAYHKNKNGKMFFGCNNGFYSFLPDEVKADLNPPGIVLTDFLIANKSISPKWKDPKSPLNKMIYATDDIINLSPKQNFFSFEFAALNYSNPKRNRYEYQLLGWKGQNNDPINTDYQNRRATFTNLDPKEYEFQVFGINADGVKSKTPAAVKIRILPTFWQTGLARIIIIIIGLIFLFLIWSAWSKKLVQKKAQELDLMNKKLNRKHEELINTQAQLVEAGRLANLGVLVTGVAHEINNPSTFTITGIHNLENSLKEFKSDFEELAGDETDSKILSFFGEKFRTLFEQLAAIREGTLRISNIVKELRKFSRNEQYEMKKVKLLEGLQITLDLVKPNFAESVEFITDFQVDPEIICNPGELNQVYMNIITNACEAMVEKQKEIGEKEKGTLTIQTHEENEDIVVTFKDTGIGISRDAEQKIFDPFFTTKSGGLGLGLSISYDIIKRHKGKIVCESELGKGTIFSVYLPKLKSSEYKKGER